MRIRHEKHLPFIVVVGIILITSQNISIASAECQTSAVHNNPSNSNGCSYPACSPDATRLTNPNQWTCVYDKSFCRSNELFVPASEVLAAGKVCSCKDILNYPELIGTCITDNLYSPMLTVDDCVGGTAVCSPNESNMFLTGDTHHPFTACDLKCDIKIGHKITVPGDTYKSCSFPKFDWTVASKSEFYNLQAYQHEIIDEKLYIGGTIMPLNRCYVDGALSRNCSITPTTDSTPLALRHLLKGPFNASNPTSRNGAYVSDIVSVTGDSARACAIAIVDKNTGEPMDLFSLNGNGTCYIDSMVTGGRDKGSNGKVIVAGGYHTGGGELIVNTSAACIPVSNALGGASTTCKSGLTTVKAHERDDTAFVFLMDPETRSVRWLIQPWLAIVDNEASMLNSYSASVTDSSLDGNGDVYISGYRHELGMNPKTYAMISKHSGVDGSIFWEQEFPEVRGIRLVQEGDALYVTLQVPRSTTGTSVLGIICNAQMCNVLARISSIDGSLHWARYTYGISHNMTNYGEVKLAHPDDGPYVYATFSSGETSNLDLGTPYSGCRTSEGNITIEIDPVFSNLKSPLNPTVCNSHGRGDYFNRTSEYALPAHLSHTRAQCRWNHSGQHCLVKYHKLTGLPVWGSVTPLSQDFQPLADGIIMTGSKNGPVFFNTVEVSAPDNSVGAHSMVYQSKIDLEGGGVYVQPIIAHQASATAAGLTQDPDTGDIYIGFLTKASKTYLGPGAPVGFIQDLQLKDECKDKGILCTEVSRITVAKLGIEEKPNCIDSCGEGGTIIKDGMCFIDQVCYMSKDTGTRIGMPCHVCDPSISQTTWANNVDNFCVIDSMCYKAGDHLTVDGIESECRTCVPDNYHNSWSLESGYEINVQEDPPRDCRDVSFTYSPTPTAFTDSYDLYDETITFHPTSSHHRTFAPTPTAMISDGYDDSIDDDTTDYYSIADIANNEKGEEEEEDDDSLDSGDDLSNRSVAGIIIGLILLSIVVVGAATAGFKYLCNKPRHPPLEFLQMEADLI